ncbi:hypothetical protein, partial [Streptococcus dysgalactiae]|uniref:hypothetical protein n=1 Tax=Streptococcus dysgalactiae TaxID=1334 RepID=UPI001951531B
NETSNCTATSGFVAVTLLGQTTSVDTYAFIDNGSDTTLLDEEIAQTIGVTGPTYRMSVQTLHGVQIVSSNQVSLKSTVSRRLNIVTVDTVRRLPLVEAQITSAAYAKKLNHIGDVNIRELTNCWYSHRMRCS